MSPLRVLVVADIWLGSNGYAYVRAFRRLGHSVLTVSSENYLPSGWKSRKLRILRRMIEPTLVREYEDALIASAEKFFPDVFFVFKGTYVTRKAVQAIKRLGAFAVNLYPDVSFLVHGKYIPQALPAYDWVFTTKTFGIKDMNSLLGVTNSSFIPHSYDPEVHFPVAIEQEERNRLESDVSFIGTWSTKKQRLLESICSAFPNIKIRIWGDQWARARSSLGERVQGLGITGLEWTKAVLSSKISLGLLSSQWKGASSGDKITARTFWIPAAGGFMLHERTDELLEYFQEGIECACFGDESELLQKVEFYLKSPDKRNVIASFGRKRCVESGYSVDIRVETILQKVNDLRGKAVRALTIALP